MKNISPFILYFIVTSVLLVCFRALLSADVNGDGWEDLVVGAPGYGYKGSSYTGVVYIVYGRFIRGFIIHNCSVSYTESHSLSVYGTSQ